MSIENKKIEALTPEQEIELQQFYKEMLDIGRSCTPINHEQAEAIITKLYIAAGEKAPKFLYYKSPKEVITKHPDVNLDHYFGGQQWIYWKALYVFARKIGVKFEDKDNELLDLWMDEAKNLHWWFPYEEYCLIVERPIRLTVNGAGQLHNESVAAIEYADGWKCYYLNGISVPEYLVVTPSEELDINFFLKEQNADVKAEFVRKFGVERMIHLGKLVDSYKNYKLESDHLWSKSQYELWDMAVLFPGLDYQPFLKMANQTTGIWHFEAVSPECRTIEAALTERFGGKNLNIINIK